MEEQAQIEQSGADQLGFNTQITLIPEVKPPVRWNLGLRIGFRFICIYFTLFSLSNQIFSEFVPIPKVSIPDLGILPPMRQITFWTAAHIFRVQGQLVYRGSGSGDKTFDWVQVFLFLAVAAASTVIWSVLDRRRPNYIIFHKWFSLVLRFALASEMFLYGISKIIPVQMRFPYLMQLVAPAGKFAPMSVLWFSVGASPAYEIFTGCAETLGGLLLIFPRTATLGALVCLADMIQVFTLNMTYDVPVKLLSFHLLLFSLFLLAPERERIVSFFLFPDRPTPPSTQPPLWRSPRALRIAVILQVVFGFCLVGVNVLNRINAWHTYGDGRPKPSLYGIWDVEQMTIDGQVRSPLINDYGRWRRVVFDVTTFTSFHRMDDSVEYFGSSIDDKAKVLKLTSFQDKNWKASLAFDRPVQDQLILDGSMDGHKIHMQLKLFDRNKFPLVNRGFHWINEYPHR